MTPLRIIYMGTPEFAVPSLQLLIENDYEVVAVITAPDKPKGRGQKSQPSPVKVAAQKRGIPVLQPTNLKSPEFIQELRSYTANLQIVVAFRMLPEVVWNMPELGTFNLHGSLLPQYRGAAPIHWAVINGEKETGVTTFFLKHAIDTGSIILQEKEAITKKDTTGTVYERLMAKGSELVLKTVQLIEKGDFELTPQNLDLDLPKAPKIFKEDCEINWNQSAEKIYNFVRGLNPFPVAWTNINDIAYKIFEVEVGPSSTADTPGVYHTDARTFINFQTANGIISVKTLQAPGKKRMNIEDFFRGNQL